MSLCRGVNARSEEAKRAIIERLFEAWKKTPWYTLGQLLCAASDKGHRLHYLDDEFIASAVERVAKGPIPDPTKSGPGLPP